MSYPYSPQDDSHGDPTRPFEGSDAPRPASEAFDATDAPLYGSSDATGGPAYGSVYGSTGAPGAADGHSSGTTPDGTTPDGTSGGYPYSAYGAAYETPRSASTDMPTGPRASGAPAAGGYAPGAPVDSSERPMAMLAHLSMLIGMLLSAGWLTFVGPLVIWVIYKDKSPFVRQAAAGSFNFALTATVASVVGWAAFASVIGIPVAIVIAIAVFVCSILFPILGAMKADKLQPYHYPMSIPVLH